MKKSFFKIGLLLLVLSFTALSCIHDKKEQGVSTVQVIGKFTVEAQGEVDFGDIPHMTFITKEGVEHKWDTKETFVSYFPPEVLEARKEAKIVRDHLIESQKALIKAQRAQIKEQAKQKQAPVVKDKE